MTSDAYLRATSRKDHSRSRSWSPIEVPLLVAAAYLLLLAAWLFSNPPGAAPDEETHYIRAAALSQGQLLGSRVQVPKDPNADYQLWQWVQRVSRGYYLPARLAPPDFAGCYAFHPRVSAACQETIPRAPAGWYDSYAALYQPTSYLLPSLLIRASRDPWIGLLVGRIGMALVSSALILFAIGMLWNRMTLSLLGLIIASTPMTFFVMPLLTPSATEVAGGICFFCALLRLVRDYGRSGRAVCLGLTLGGLALAASRPAGPIFVAADILTVIILMGPREVFGYLRQADRKVYMSLAAVLFAVIFTGVWSLLVGAQNATSLRSTFQGLPYGLAEIPRDLQQEIGVFGWLDTEQPAVVYLAWIGALSLLLVTALFIGSWRQRLALALLVVFHLLTIAVITAAVHASTGGNAQGRYYLPLGVAIPLLAGHILTVRAARLGPLRLVLPLGVALVVGPLQVLAWWVNARRYAVGSGPRLFILHDVAWRPAGGWWPWLTLAVVSSLLLVVAFAVGSQAQRRLSETVG